MKIPLQPVITDETIASGCKLYLLREDLRGEEEGGNKFFKLKYNLEMARASGFQTILSFGGVYSNHIAALAAAGKREGLKTVGVIRGEEQTETSTIRRARENGMVIHYLSREAYRRKDSPEFIEELKVLFGEFYLIPEGASNALGVDGCREIVNDITIDFDMICVPSGTGATAAGIVLSLKNFQELYAFQVLKAAGMIKRNINGFLEGKDFSSGFTVIEDYHFGGYARSTEELNGFIKKFYQYHEVKLDHVYTGKMMFGILDLMKRGLITSKTIVAVHTGGIQGVSPDFFD
jgi:1-aminocyclopropane-1-carboxylate deaminase